MEKIPWYKSNTLRALGVAALMQVLAVAGLADQFDADTVGKYVDGGLDLIAFLATVYAAWARARQPTPPVTDIAVARTVERANKQGGRATLGILLLLSSLVLVLGGCAGLRSAWQAADTADEQAYVLAEQYASLVKEAADLAQKPTTPRMAITAMQEADRKAKPVVLNMKRLRDAYVAIDSAENEEALQKAVNDAVLLINDMVRAVKVARGEL